MEHNDNQEDEIRPTATVEDYLILMYVMERDHEDIIAARLAEALEVSPPTVTTTLKRMERDGWILTEGRQGIYLTDSGRDAARSVMNRHMLTEWVLMNMLGVSWSKIHEEAHRIEHTISDEIEKRMREHLDDPRICPHGNPMPGYEHLVAHWSPLTEMAVGESGTMRRVHEMAEDRNALMRFLEANHLLPGERIKIVGKLPFNQTLDVEVRGKKVTLGFAVARFIYAEP
jgi:DtxR family transcriptional regulator, Mn-dependent transcriptional regulator